MEGISLGSIAIALFTMLALMQCGDERERERWAEYAKANSCKETPSYETSTWTCKNGEVFVRKH